MNDFYYQIEATPIVECHIDGGAITDCRGTDRVVEGVILRVEVTVIDGKTGLVEDNSVHANIGCERKNYQVCTACRLTKNCENWMKSDKNRQLA